jgi:hypothetical protein
MKITILSLRKVSCLILAMLFTLSSVSLSQKNTSVTQAPGSVQLKYKYSSENPVKYMNNNKVLQTMDVNGQSMLVNVTSVLGCTVRSTGSDGNNLKLEIKIDTMAQSVDSPNGYTGGPITEAIGKVFNMVISPEGKETDISEAEKIIFMSQTSGQGNVGESFFDFFPDMPTEYIVPGYTWTTNDTVTSNNPNMSMVMVIKSENKFDGMEKINGKDCAKISSVISGTRNMKTQSQGMDIHINGPFNGNSELFFAPSEGYFTKHTINTKMTGMIEIASPENMSFPVVMDISSVNEVRE